MIFCFWQLRSLWDILGGCSVFELNFSVGSKCLLIYMHNVWVVIPVFPCPHQNRKKKKNTRVTELVFWFNFGKDYILCIILYACSYNDIWSMGVEKQLLEVVIWHPLLPWRVYMNVYGVSLVDLLCSKHSKFIQKMRVPVF